MSAGNGKAAYTYKYNANGDMVEAKSSGSTKTFTYNCENRMTGMTVTGTGAGSWTYSYDADGERTVKKNNTTGTYTVYWFDNYEETYKNSDSSVALTESVKYYKANDGTVAQRVTDKTKTSENEKLTYLFKDVLGSTVKVCDENGNVTEFMGYVPYGEQVLLSGSKDAKKTYTGQEPETDDGLYYYHARYYDSRIGRFIQSDSVLDGLNRYCYCGNNPVNFTDPTGEKLTLTVDKKNQSMTVSLSLKLGKKEFNKSFTVKVTTHVVANSDSSQPNKAANENLNPKKHNDNGSAWTQCPNGEWNITGVKDGPNKNVDGTVKDKQLTTDVHQLLPERKEDGTIKIDKNGDVMKVDDSGYNIHYTDNSNTAGCIGVKNEMQMKAIIYLFRLNERIDPKSSTLKVIGSEE